MIIARTPLRISFLGGGTDYPEYFIENHGEVLATAIDKFSYITITHLTEFFDYSIRVAYSKVELVNKVRDIQHPAIRACLEYTSTLSNVEISCVSDLPSRTGLGSSSSFVVALLKALYAHKREFVSNEELANIAIKIERDILKESVGCQDQMITALGGFQHIQFHSRENIRYEPVLIPDANMKDLSGSLLLFFTGIKRSASLIACEQIERTAINIPYLNQMKSLVKEGIASLYSRDALAAFGKIIHQSWELKKSLSSKISNPTIDDAYETAIKAGAIGGKLLGAGGGGFLLFVVPPKNQAKVRAALAAFKEVQFKFEHEGAKIIYHKGNV